MKREFLLSLKVGEEVLPKEIIDAIMAENGKDIQAAKDAAVKPFADYETLREENQRLSQLQAESTPEGKTAQQWRQAYLTAVQEHQKELEDISFRGLLDSAIRSQKGRNTKAITALLDVDSLKTSENREKDIQAALEGLKKDCGYLFDTEAAPPPYATGTGTAAAAPAATSLASALREKFNT